MGGLSCEPQIGPRTDHGTHARYGALRSGGIRRTTQEGEKLEEFPLIVKELPRLACLNVLFPPSRGSPWVFNITPILGRCARMQLECPIPARGLPFTATKF